MEKITEKEELISFDTYLSIEIKFINSKIMSLFLLLLPLVTSAQQKTIDLATINYFKQNCQEVTNIQSQRIPENSYLIRFTELGKIYNPNFPDTRNKVFVTNYMLDNSELAYIGKSISTNRASIIRKGRVGTFYSIWANDLCNSMLEYEVKKEGDQLAVTGKIYRCISVP